MSSKLQVTPFPTEVPLSREHEKHSPKTSTAWIFPSILESHASERHRETATRKKFTPQEL